MATLPRRTGSKTKYCEGQIHFQNIEQVSECDKFSICFVRHNVDACQTD